MRVKLGRGGGRTRDRLPEMPSRGPGGAPLARGDDGSLSAPRRLGGGKDVQRPFDAALPVARVPQPGCTTSVSRMRKAWRPGLQRHAGQAASDKNPLRPR